MGVLGEGVMEEGCMLIEWDDWVGGEVEASGKGLLEGASSPLPLAFSTRWLRLDVHIRNHMFSKPVA